MARRSRSRKPSELPATLRPAAAPAPETLKWHAADNAGNAELPKRLAADYPAAPMISPRLCALPLERCVSGCACAARPSLRIRLLRLWPDLYIALLWRAALVGYVPFDSEVWSRASCSRTSRSSLQLADPEPTTPSSHQSMRPYGFGSAASLLPKQIDGVRILGIDVPGFGVPTHAEAKDVLVWRDAHYARTKRNWTGPSARGGRSERPTVTCWAKCFRPIHWDRYVARAAGPSAGPVVPTREWRELYAALDCAVAAAIHPQYAASCREFAAAGRPIVGSRRGLRWHRELARRHRSGVRHRPGQGRRRQEQIPPGHRRSTGSQANQGTGHRLRLRRL